MKLALLQEKRLFTVLLYAHVCTVSAALGANFSVLIMLLPRSKEGRKVGRKEGGRVVEFCRSSGAFRWDIRKAL